MAKVVADISVSLDGFVAGPNDGVDNPLGDGGERPHDWLIDLASFRERHGLPGGRADRDAEVVVEALVATRLAEIAARRKRARTSGPLLARSRSVPGSQPSAPMSFSRVVT